MLLKETNPVPFTEEDTVALYSRSQLNFIFLQSHLIVNTQQLAKDPAVADVAKKAIVSAAESMMLASAELYYRLSQAYGME